MRSASIVALLAIAQISAAAPAPIVQTIWQTATQVYNTDGSIYTVVDPLQNAVAATTSTPPAIPSTTSATAAAAATTGSKFSLDSLLNDGKVKEWLDWFGIGSSSDSSAASSTTAVYVAPATTSSSSSLFSTSSSRAPLWPTTSSTASASEPLSTGGIYDDIYKAADIDKTFAKAILDSHNGYRADHSTGPLSWDNNAYEYAKNNADSYDCSGVLTHTHGQYGENLAAGFPDGPSAVKAWYDEGETYDYLAANTYDHFTQVVWKGSTKVGCAYKDCSSTGWQKYIICSYDPPGNFVGENRANVLPLSS